MIKPIVTVAVVTMLSAMAVSAQVSGQHRQMSDTTSAMGMAQGMMMGSMMGQGMMGSGMMQMMGQGMGMMATGGPGATAMLTMRDALDLSDEQVSRLETIRDELATTVQPLMTAMMASHTAAAGALQGDTPQLGAYQQNLQTAANIMVQTHVAMAQAQVQARRVLTPEQRERLAVRGMQMMQGAMGADGMMTH